MPRLPIVVALLCMALPLGAQTARSLPPDVETVVTGGWWQHGPREGRYRAVIRSGGFEHVISTLTVDWIVGETESDSAKVVASTELEVASVALFRPRFTKVGPTWLLIVSSADSHFDPPRRGAYRVTLGTPGAATIKPDRAP